MLSWMGAQLASAATNIAKDKIAERVADASKDFGVLTEEQYAIMANIFESVQNHQTTKAQKDLQSLAAHISAQEYQDLSVLINAKDIDQLGQLDQLDQWVQAKREYVGTPGLVKKAAATFFSTITDQAKRHMGAWYENFRAPAPNLDAFSEALQGVSQPPVKPVQRSEIKVEQEILTQRQLLIQNTTQMAMAKTVLGWACGIQNLTDQTIVSYMENANQYSTDFRVVIFNEIDKADNVSGLRKFLAKACYMLLEPIVGFYVTHFTENFLAYFRSFLAEFNNGNFTLNRSVKFLNGHLQMVGGAYSRAANDPEPSADIDDSMKHDLERPEFNGGMIPAELFVSVAEESIERFAPVSSLREKVSAALSSVRIDNDSKFAWLNYPLAAATGLVTLTVAPIFFLIEWSGNALAKMALKKLVVDLKLVPSLVASTGHAIGMGEDYKHALNELMVRQLEEAWRLLTTHTDESASQFDISAFERTLSDITRADLKSFVSSLFLDLGYTLHSDNRANLQAYVKGQSASSMPESLKALFEALGIPLDIQEEAKETTVKYLALLLSTVLKKETLNEFTLTSLTTLNQSCFTLGGQRPSKEQMAATELRRNKLLGDIVNTAIRQAVNDKFYPMQRIQKEANQFILQMNLDVVQFDTEMHNLQREGYFSQMVTTYNQFIVARDKALLSQQGSPNVNNHSLSNFNAISKALMERLGPMKEILKTLSQYEQQSARATIEAEALESLNNIFARLSLEDHSDPTAHDIALEMMQQFGKDTLPNLQNSDDLSELNIKPMFNEIVAAITEYNFALEAIAVAKYLRSIIESRNTTKKTLAKEITNYKFASSKAELLKQLLNTAVNSETLNVDFLTIMITQYEKTAETCTETFARHAKFTETLQPLRETRAKTLEENKNKIAQQVTTLQGHSNTLAIWASNKEVIKDQIKALGKPVDKDSSVHTAVWDTDTLQPFQCQNTFPIDLTVFADTVREFVVRQITAYTHAIPLFYAKEYNWESLMRRMMVTFVQDKRRIVHPPTAG